MSSLGFASPAGLRDDRRVGHGMNEEELSQDPAPLNEFLVQDLNLDPRLPHWIVTPSTGS